MNTFLNKFYNIVEKIGKRNFMLIVFVFLVLLINGLFQTFSLYTSSGGFSVIDDLKTYKFILSNNEENSVTIAANSSKKLMITVSNSENMELKYGIYYSSMDNLSDVNLGYLSDSAFPANGNIKSKEDCVVNMQIDNNSNSAITINLGTSYGLTTGGDLLKEETQTWVDIYKPMANKPNLDNDNLIPVYYDEEAEVWRKADSTNVNNSWYDYNNKKWANAISIKDSIDRAFYQEIEIGQEIPLSVIDAFYVWIPRYKYRVWNINRQGGNENTYAYSAYSTGIEIVWESENATTGNIECTYDTLALESATNLSDVCIYNKKDTITTASINSNYKDAWYTHPAFTFGNTEKTGFWIGKFETSGKADYPTILPDAISLRNQTISEQFTTSKILETYGLSSDIDAHVLTNLEWGAVAYLTHSAYGLCDETNCRDVYVNNSSDYYTGRSAGVLATVSTANTYGNYNYLGYLLDNEGMPTANRDKNKIASTTGNITGIYDIVGGAYETVMGNMVDEETKFYPSSSGIDWNGSPSLNSKYYNSYSYGTDVYTQVGFNRARLGDATAEAIGSEAKIYTTTWQPGSIINGSSPYFVTTPNSWFIRGGYDVDFGSFDVETSNGEAIDSISFRVTLS